MDVKQEIEQLRAALNEAGYDTGINFSKILAAAKYQVSKISGNYSGHHITIDKETPCCF